MAEEKQHQSSTLHRSNYGGLQGTGKNNHQAVSHVSGQVRSLQGTVVSNKMNDTAIVSIVSKKVHSKYKKSYKVTRRFNCHNKGNSYKEGDVVIFEECRPISKTKRWRIVAKVK